MSSSGSKPRWASSGTCAVDLGGAGDEELAEGPGVDEAQLAALGEGDDHVGVLVEGVLGPLGPLELAAHAQMDDQHVVAVEAEEEVLAGPADRRDGAALEPGPELLAVLVATDRALALHLDRLDPPADDLLVRSLRIVSTSGSSGIAPHPSLDRSALGDGLGNDRSRQLRPGHAGGGLLGVLLGSPLPRAAGCRPP